jgi:hypothetical protein
MGGGEPSNFFLIAGIVLNVALTALAIWWLLKQGVRKPPPKPPGDRRETGATTE